MAGINIGANADYTITVNYSTHDGTAAAGTKYSGITNATLTFNNGETLKTFTIPILEENQIEGDQTFTVSLSNVQPPGSAQLVTSTATGRLTCASSAVPSR